MEYVRQGVLNDTSLAQQQRQDLTTFMSRVPEFDLLETPVDRFLSANGGALDGLADPQKLRLELKRLQRTFRITQRYQSARSLLNKGWDSALIIAETPFSRFQEAVRADLGGFDEAKEHYSRSKQIAANTGYIYGTISQFKNDSWPAAIGSPNVLILLQGFDGVANWETLFGSIDFCKCEHCRSVYGPAAYFVDVLQLLRRDGPPFTALMNDGPTSNILS